MSGIKFGQAVQFNKFEDDPIDPNAAPPVIEFDKYWNVVDPETGEVIGTISYPSHFCPGISCEAGRSQKHPFAFRNQGLTCVHMHCGKPTEAYASVTYRDTIHFKESYSLPWEMNTDQQDSK